MFILNNAVKFDCKERLKSDLTDFKDMFVEKNGKSYDSIQKVAKNMWETKKQK